jgi:outer membrane immunogenic protein
MPASPLGGASSTADTSQGINSVFCTFGLRGCPAFGSAFASALPGSFKTFGSGVIGGGEVGWNWQSGHLVWGIETDFSATDISGSQTVAPSAVPVGFPGRAVNVQETVSERLSYLGTVRGRLGYTLMNSLLAYGTGGFAYGQVKSSASLAENLSGGCACGPFPTVIDSQSTTMTGWTVGGGLEWRFAPQWTLMGEYLHYDLGTLENNLGLIQANGLGAPFYGATTTVSSKVEGEIGRVGINFGWDVQALETDDILGEKA